MVTARIPVWLPTVLVILIAVVDQTSKSWCSANLEMGVPITVLPGFDLLLSHNYGAAFSFLDFPGGWQRWLFTGISTVVGIGLVIWLWLVPKDQKLLVLALTFILGGDLGNLWDRATLGYVVDFISIYYQEWRFATFNVADAAISCGAFLLALDIIFGSDKHEGK